MIVALTDLLLSLHILYRTGVQLYMVCNGFVEELEAICMFDR